MKPKKDITIYDIALRLDLSSATVSRSVIVHELNSNFITSVLAGIEKVTTV